jgi:hypothetical protein
MDKSGAGAGFLRELRFPLPICIPSASPQSSSLSPEAGTIGQEWPQYQEAQSHPTKNKKINKGDGIFNILWHVDITCMSYYRWVFGLMMEFIRLFDTVRDCTLQFIITHTHIYTNTTVHSHVFAARFSVAAFNRGRSPFSGVSERSRALARSFSQ